MPDEAGRTLREVLAPPRWLWPTLAAALLLSLIAAGDGVLPGDVAAARAVQRLVLPELRGVVEVVNALGRAVPGAATVTLAVVLLLLRRGQRSAALLVGATLPLRAVNPVLKALVDSPRPSDALVAVTERADGLGFPSGHATGAMLLYGAIFAIAPLLTGSSYLRWTIRVAAMLAIVIAGVCRVAVGAHWPTDVLGGYLWGGVLLGALLGVVRTTQGDGDRTARSSSTVRPIGVRGPEAGADT